MVEVLENPKERPRFREFAAQHIGIQARKGNPGDREALVPVLEKSLEDKEVGVRRESLWALARLRSPLAAETAKRWLGEEHRKDVHDICIRVLAEELDLRETAPLIRPFLRDPALATRIQAILALSRWQDEESRAAFLEAAGSEDEMVRRAGLAAIQRLNKEPGGPSEKAGEPPAPGE